MTEGVIDPVLVAVPAFVREGATSKGLVSEMAEVVANDLSRTGLFRAIPQRSHISRISNFFLGCFPAFHGGARTVGLRVVM